MTQRSNTLRARLLFGTAIATAALLAGAFLLVYVFVRLSLIGEFDTALGSSTRALAALTEQKGRVVTMEPEAMRLPEFTRKSRPDYFALYSADGKLLMSSVSLRARPLSHRTPALGATLFEAVTLPDGMQGRQATLRFIPTTDDEPERLNPSAQPVTIVVGSHTINVHRRLTSLAWLLAGVGSAATAITAGAMLVVVRRGLQPLDLLAKRISSVGRQDLGERIELNDAPRELTTVVARLNELLDRLQSTIMRERRFTGDVAHELRTPLAGLETILDVCAMRPRKLAEYQRSLSNCAQIVRGMHVMVENLMTLARADAMQLNVDRTSVRIAPLVNDCWRAFESTAKERKLTAVFQIDPTMEVVSDAEKLRIVFSNLLANAVSYADAGGWIRVHETSAENRVVLNFSNSGSKLTQKQAEQAFDRFWRADPARHDAGSHHGLGLSLCREILTVLSGEIRATSDAEGIFCASVFLSGDMELSIPQEEEYPANIACETLVH